MKNCTEMEWLRITRNNRQFWWWCLNSGFHISCVTKTLYLKLARKLFCQFMNLPVSIWFRISLVGRDKLVDVGVDGRIIFIWVYRNGVFRMWSELKWQRIVDSNTICEYFNEPFSCVNCEESVEQQSDFQLLKYDTQSLSARQSVGRSVSEQSVKIKTRHHSTSHVNGQWVSKPVYRLFI
jgi:hypothetical protein